MGYCSYANGVIECLMNRVEEEQDGAMGKPTLGRRRRGVGRLIFVGET